MSDAGDHEERRQFNEEIERLKELVRDLLPEVRSTLTGSPLRRREIQDLIRRAEEAVK